MKGLKSEHEENRFIEAEFARLRPAFAAAELKRFTLRKPENFRTGAQRYFPPNDLVFILHQQKQLLQPTISEAVHADNGS